jgi:glucosamine-6-phosphate deaminase
MQVIIVSDYAALSKEGARRIAHEIVSKPASSLVPASGDTPVGTWNELIDLQKAGEFDPSELTICQLDEYLGLQADDVRTLWGWSKRTLVTPLGIPEERCIRLNCDTENAAATCAAYDAAVDKVGGFDLCVLGLGPNGHLGFNEPPADETATTRELVLSEESLQSNASYWGGRDRVPLRAMTAGMRQILASKRIFLLVSGRKKRDILDKVINGPVTPEVPASYLQLHPNVLIIADEDAAA